MKKLNRSSKKKMRSSLRVETLEQRQLLAGITGGGTEVGSNIVHSNGNVYDQVLMTGSSVAVTADAGQVTRVSFLDLSGDIVQVEFSGAGSLNISLDSDTFKGPAEATTYNQPGVKYVTGLASFTITGSDASTNFSAFTVGTGTAHRGADNPIFAGGKLGGNNLADVQRLTVVADPSNANGSAFGGIRMGNAVFGGSSGVVGISAANVQVQDTVVIGDINTTSLGVPTLTFGTNSNFSVLKVAGGDLVNPQNLTNSGIRQINYIAGTDSAGRAIPAQGLDNKAPTAVSFTNTVTSLAEDASTSSRVKVADIAVADDARGTNSLALSGADASKFELVGNALFLKAGTALNFEAQTSYAVTVSASDSTVAGSSAVSSTFTLGVTNVNETPTITSSGSVSTTEDTAIAFTVVGADVDAGTTLTYTAGAASKGTITGGTNGAFVYTPNANANGADSFVVTVSDGKLSTTQTVNVAITAANDAPVAVADSASVVMGNVISIDVAANDTDVDGNTVSLTGTPTATLGTVSIVGGALSYVAPSNYIGEATISYSITDGTATVNATQTVNVTQPTISRSAASVDEGSSATFTINGVPNTDYAIRLEGTATPGTDYAGATLAQVTTNASGVATFSLAPSRDKSTEGSETVIATIVGFTGSQTITIGDASVNNVAPAFTSSATQTATEDTVKTFSIAATDGNAEDSVSYTLGAVVGGTATLSGTTVTFTPTPDFNGDASVVVTATDNHAAPASTSQTVAITVAAVNDTPTLAAIADQSATEDTVLTFATAAADVDVETLTYTATGATKGSVSIAGDGTVTYTPSLNANGSDSFTLTVTDGSGATASRTVSVAIAAVNDAPVASTIAAQTARQDSAFSFNAASAFSDVDNATLTYSATGLPTGLSINASTGVISGTPTLATVEAGASSVIVTATDGVNSTSAAAFNLTTSASYTIAASSVTSVNEGASVTYTITNTARTLGEIINYTIVPSNASSADFDAGLSGQAVFNASGQATITIGVTADTLTEAGAETFSVNFAVGGADVVRAGTITVNDTSVTGDLNRELTAGADTGANFTLGVGNDTFNGRTTVNSLNTSDVLSGGAAGTDMVTAILNQTGGINVRPTLTSVETVEITNSAAPGGNTATVDLGSATGVTKVASLQSSDAVTFTNVSGVTQIDAVLTTQALTVNYTDLALSGAETANLRLDNADGIAVTIGNSTNGGINLLETLNVNFDVNVDGTPAVTLAGPGTSVITSSIDASTTAYTITSATAYNGSTIDASALTKRVNLTSSNVGTHLIGGTAADVLTGSAAHERLSGGAGNDTINGAGGADTIDGGLGDDTFQFLSANLTAGRISDASGSNTIVITDRAQNLGDAAFVNKSGAATLTLSGTQANTNTVTLGTNAEAAGITTVNAANTNGDTINASAYATLGIAIVGGAGADSLTGGAGADTITLGAGQDTAIGGDGNDTIVGAGNVTDADSIVGGAGTDTLTLSGSTTLTTGNLISGVETYTLNSRGTTSTTTVTGYVYVVDIDNDNDPDAAVTTDTLTVNASALLLDVNTTDGGDQSETLDFDGSGVTAAFKLSVTGGAANDTLVGGSLADTLTGGGANDGLTGGLGADTFNVDAGTDTITDLGDGADVLVVAAGATANATVPTTFTATAATTNDGTASLTLGNGAAANLSLAQGSAGFTVTAGTGSTITGSAQNDTLVGNTGNDVLNAGAGTNVINSVGTGTDAITHNTANATVTINVSGTASVAVTASQAGASVTAAAGVNTVVDATTSTAGVTFLGATGNDTFTLGTGADIVNAMEGSNTINAVGFGQDVIQHSAASSTVTVNVSGASVVTLTATSSGASAVSAVGVNTTVDATTSTAAVSLTGNTGTDTLTGGSGIDLIRGGAGADSLTGNAGNDVFIFALASESTGALADTITDFATGADKLQITLPASASVNVSGFASVTSFSNGLVSLTNTGVSGDSFYSSADGKLYVDVDGDGVLTQGTDYVISAATVAAADLNFVIAGHATNNSALTGGAGADTITGDAGDDILTGGLGNDSLTGDSGADTFNVDAGTDTITDLGDGGDILVVSAGAVANVTVPAGVTFTAAQSTINNGATTLTLAEQAIGVDLHLAAGTTGFTVNAGGDGDSIIGSGRSDTVNGGAGDDTLNGDAGNDVITGGLGNDSITGGSGNDTINTNGGVDTVTDAGVGNDTISHSAGTAAIAVSDTGTVTLNASSTGATTTSAAGVNTTVNAAASTADVTLNGNSGADTLTGGAGADTIGGGAGADSITGGAGSDRLTGGADADTFVLTTTASADTITDFAVGAGGDVLQVDISDLGLAGSTHFEGAAGSVNADGSEEIVVLTASYTDDADAAAAVAATVTTDGLAMVIVYHNTTTGKVHVIHTTNSNTGANVTLLATMDNITTVGDLTNSDSTNFGGRP